MPDLPYPFVGGTQPSDRRTHRSDEWPLPYAPGRESGGPAGRAPGPPAVGAGPAAAPRSGPATTTATEQEAELESAAVHLSPEAPEPPTAEPPVDPADRPAPAAEIGVGGGRADLGAEDTGTEDTGTADAATADAGATGTGNESPGGAREGTEFPDFIFGSDAEQAAAGIEDAMDAGTVDAGTADIGGAGEPQSGGAEPEELERTARALLQGPHGTAIRKVLDALEDEPARDAALRAFAAGYLAAREEAEG